MTPSHPPCPSLCQTPALTCDQWRPLGVADNLGVERLHLEVRGGPGVTLLSPDQPLLRDEDEVSHQELHLILLSWHIILDIFLILYFRGDKKCCRQYTGLGQGYGCDLCRVNPKVNKGR